MGGGSIGKIIVLTFNDTEEKAVKKIIATLADSIQLEIIQPCPRPFFFPGPEIRLHQRRVLKGGADISLTRLEYGYIPNKQFFRKWVLASYACYSSLDYFLRLFFCNKKTVKL